MRKKIKEILNNPKLIGQEETIKGWVRTVRQQKEFTFVEVNDGSCLANIQIVVPSSLFPEDHLTTGASVAIKGKVVESQGGKQKVEIQATQCQLIGKADPTTYPLQKKKHTFEFLRTIAHLRPRTNTLGAVLRIRNFLAFATHRFFQERGFYYLHTPIITLSDAEGAGVSFTQLF